MHYLTLAIHYPKDEHLKDITEALKEVGVTAKTLEGCIEAGAWYEESKKRIIMLSIWQSTESAMKAPPILRPLIAKYPWSEWERQPPENMLQLTSLVD